MRKTKHRIGCPPGRVRGRHQSHRDVGLRPAGRPLLGAGPEPARHAIHGAHRCQQYAGDQCARQPHRVQRPDHRAQSRHLPASFDRINALRREAELRFREKEQELVLRLEETEERLVALEETKQEEDALLLSDAQQSELTRFREERLAVRRELRDVRRELRRSIESLEGWIKFVNIGLMPILIGLLWTGGRGMATAPAAPGMRFTDVPPSSRLVRRDSFPVRDDVQVVEAE